MAVAENITVLFTDLVGSTELASSLTPDAADEVRRNHFSVLRKAIAAKGGTEVKNLGDGLMVVFPIASAGLACAVAMQQAVDRDNTGAGRPLGLRVGLSAGEATREADDYFGDPVIEAARLCARADFGQILVASLVRANAGRRSSHSFTSLGELDLKGLPHAVETLELRWDPLTDDAALSGGVPLPGRLVQRPNVGVVGRDVELASLLATVKRVASGEGREVVLIAGEPGQGKTTLVSEIARRAHEDGMTVLLGRCDEEVGVPYQPFHEGLTHYVAHTAETLLRCHVDAHGGELEPLVPALHRRLGDLPSLQSTDPDTERYLLYGATVGLLELASVQTPVVVVLDDLHWADKPSLQLFRHIVANTATTRLLILATYRDAELSASHPLTEALGGLLRQAGVTSIDLRGLDDTSVMAFMEAAAGHGLDEAGVELAHQVYRETDGNPFFVAEMLRNLAESGAIHQDSTGRWTAAHTEGQLALPHSVRAVIGSRLARLGDDATKLLATAAVIGRDFDLDLLAEATGGDEDEIIDVLDKAQRAALVAEVDGIPGRYSFSHALVQHTLYEDLGGTKRTRLHKTVGEAIERLYGTTNEERVGELARHFLLATRPANADKAITYAQRAGETALAALAPDDAVRYLSQALELLGRGAVDDPTRRIELLVGLGKAQRQAGIPAFRETLLDAARQARQLGDIDRLVAAALANNRGWFSSFGQLDTERVELIEAALHALSTSDSPDRARLLATLCSEIPYHSPLERRLALADEAKAIARRLGDRGTFVDVVAKCGAALKAPSTLATQLRDHAEAIAAATDLDDPYALIAAANTAYSLAVRAGQFELAAERLALLRDATERIGHPSFLWLDRNAAAGAALIQGDTEKAEQLVAAAFELGTASGQPDAFAYYGVQLIGTRDQQGRLGEIVSLVANAVAQHPSVPAYRAALTKAHLHANDHDAARRLIDEAAADVFSLPENNAWLDGMANYSEAVIELRLPAHSERLIERLVPFRDQVPYNGLTPQAPVATFLGGLATLLGRFDGAEDYFAQAAGLNARGEMRFAQAYTNMLWGRMLHRRNGPGDASRARNFLEKARDTAGSHGYAMVERRATTELSTLG